VNTIIVESLIEAAIAGRLTVAQAAQVIVAYSVGDVGVLDAALVDLGFEVSDEGTI
jgi:hypothetical protein